MIAIADKGQICYNAQVMSTYRIPLKEYPVDLKPRERLKKLGTEALSDSELVALLLCTGTPQKTAIEVAQQVLLACPGQNLQGLSQLNLSQLCHFPGLGLAKATRVMAAVEMGRRLAAAPESARVGILQPADVAAMLQPRYGHKAQEHFIVLILNTKNQVVAQSVVTIGLLNTTLIHPRELFQVAISHHAHAVIIAHNHPSGDPAPSTDDVNLTTRLIECGELLGIPVLDHVIFGPNHYLSLRETTALWDS